MNKSFILSMFGGWLTLVVVVVFMLVIWSRTSPSGAVAVDPALTPLALDSINAQSTADLSSLVKNGNLPVTVSPTDIGRDNPFTPY